MLGNTPMMKQYKEIKDQHPDTILFYRLGDFYEMFGKDAILASRELEITLTGRDAGMKERVPMCGIPYHAADSYIGRLIEKGYKVAICEQVEDPKASKGIVKREVIRVITPGTALDAQLIHDQANMYLVALSRNKQKWGLAFCDVTTGEFWLSEFGGLEGKNVLCSELTRLNPAEILVPEGDKSNILPVLNLLDDTLITTYNDDNFTYSKSSQIICNHFNVTSLEKYDYRELKQAISSAGVILNYLQDTQKTAPQQIKEIKIYYPEAYLIMDMTTFRNLELTRTLRSSDKKGSLLDLLDKTKTACGLRLLQHWLHNPLTDKNLLEKRLNAVEILSQKWSERQKMRADLEKVFDVERLMTRILYGRANPRELISFKNSLAVLPSIINLLITFKESVYIADLKNEIDPLEDVWFLLDTALENEPALNLKDGGVIKQGYNKSIDELRETSKNGRTWIAELEKEEKEKTGIKSLKIGFNKVFGYYFEVTKANLGLVPEYFQRKQTLAGGERYVTEELSRLESQVLGAEEKLLSYEEEIYSELLKELGQSAQRVQSTFQILAQLDVLQSLAEVAIQNQFVKPEILDKKENIIRIEDLRHPVVEKVLSESPYVPNDLDMSDRKNLYIITGPNMGGKSTYCRSVALAVIMAQMGSFVPAKKAVISLRDRVFARVGASDDLRSGQSTFMVEMNEVANILNHATKDSLVILDEIGRGTSTYDGMSVAWAVSEYLINEVKAKTLFATHYHELTMLSSKYEGVDNFSVAVKEKGEDIILLHKIIEGAADRSYGIQVARLAGVPSSVIDRAKEVLAGLEKKKNNNQDTLDIFTSQEPILEGHNGENKSELINGHEPVNEHEYEHEHNEKQQMVLNMVCGEKDRSKSINNVLKEDILKIDLLSMTPLAAMNKLYQIQQRLKEDRASEEE
ncbi:MAG: DNA mismatch repair protein MutS [Clostridia bacterium]|nr:DNA mismatch repair protein MutS [Clostridia bacterium]MDD4047290.1 DNA mismatch repair protein MutS [Clostridia bacterium]